MDQMPIHVAFEHLSQRLLMTEKVTLLCFSVSILAQFLGETSDADGQGGRGGGEGRGGGGEGQLT